MLPSQLHPEQFSRYPPKARQLVTSRIAVLREMPLSLLPLVLREAIVYDWKFPAEQRELDHQLEYLSSLSVEQLRLLMQRFAQVRLSQDLERMDWVNEPRRFSERLTAHLWATHQIDAFREAALEYGRKVEETSTPAALPIPRLGIIIIGTGVAENKYPLFRKLRPFGVYFKQVDAADGRRILLEAVSARAQAHPVPYGHWYIDGLASEPLSSAAVTCISYENLAAARTLLLGKMQRAIQTGSGPEALRTELAEMRPEELGLSGAGQDAIVNRFAVSVLTEGSGTQLFSTSFVQWSAREALRRAEPLTLMARFTPRQRDRSMNELIARAGTRPELDAAGSLIDGDMSAYYTWINQQRLPGAEQSSFLVWFEDHNEALAVGPTLPRATESSSRIGMLALLKQVVS